MNEYKTSKIFWFKLRKPLFYLILFWILYTLFHAAYETFPYALKSITINDMEFLGSLVIISEIGIAISFMIVLFNIFKYYKDKISHGKILTILMIILIIPVTLFYYSGVNTYQVKRSPTIIIDTALPYVCGSEIFRPSVIKVIIGINNTVVWKNISPYTQSVVSFDNSFSSGPIPPGGEWTFTFTKNGTYRYRSGFYSWVQGVVIVEEG